MHYLYVYGLIAGVALRLGYNKIEEPTAPVNFTDMSNLKSGTDQHGSSQPLGTTGLTMNFLM